MSRTLYQPYTAHPKQQSGVVLLVSLVILLLISILAVSGGQSAAVQERMTFAAQDARTALQSAEIALRQAELYIEASINNTSGFNDSGTNGLYSTGKVPEDIWASSMWTDTNSRTATLKASDQANNSRYFIEYLGPIGTIHHFRIIARGEGSSSTSERMIEGYYAKVL